MRTIYRSIFVAGMLALAACGSSGKVSGNTGDPNDPNSPGQENRSDDEFKRRDVTQVAAPVYLEGINPAAQDAFRDGVRAVSLSKPDFKTAEKKFKEAAEKAPDFLEAYFNWGQAIERQGRGDDAIAVYQKALDQNPGNASASAYIAKIYLGKARSARLLGNTAEFERLMARAKGYLDQVSAKDSTNVATNNALALYHLMRDEMDIAEKYVKEVLYVEPSNVTGLNTRGLINLKRGKYLLAQWIFENKLLDPQNGADPTSTEAHTNLGYTYIKLDLRPLAMQHFQAALESDPENMEVRENIAAMLLEHLDYAHAFGHYEKILQSQPNNMEAKIGRCDSMFGMGGAAEDKNKQFTAALNCYDAYVKEKPDRSDLYKRIADTYQNKLQNLEKAVEYYELYGKMAKLDAKEADRNQKTIIVLKDIIAKGGLKALDELPMPDEQAPPDPNAPAPDAKTPPPGDAPK